VDNNLSPAALEQLISQIEPVLDLKETTISKVFLTRSYVFKVKKKIKLPFVDLLSLKDRLKFVRSEIKLNRRLCPEIYLGYSLIECTEEGFGWSALSRINDLNDNELPLENAVEVVLVMNRLKSEYTLDELIKTDGKINSLLAPIAKTLIPFYRANLIDKVTSDELRSSLKEAIEGNFSFLETFFQCQSDISRQDIILRLKDYSANFIKDNDELFSKRAEFVADCHGDLKPEHICFDPDYSSPQIFDCLEFSRSLRTIDVLNDLAFLLMEFDFLDRSDCSKLLTNHLKSSWSELFCASFLKLYKIYRALVRAKLLLLRSLQIDSLSGSNEFELAQRYIALASRYMLGLTRPVLILICGQMGCGKSTLANEINKHFAFKMLSTDLIRREYYPPDLAADYGKGQYTKDKRLAIYEEMLKRAKKHLARENSVILDGNFPYRELRIKAAALAEQHQLPLAIIHCVLSEDILRARLKKRELSSSQGPSDARQSLLLEQIRDYQEVTAAESEALIFVDMEKSVSENAQHVIDFMKANFFEES